MMIEIQESKKSQRLWERLPLFYMMASLFVLFGTVCFYWFYPDEREELAMVLKREKEVALFSFDYSLIGEGPLCLQPTGVIPNLRDEVLILARNTRPDQKERQDFLLLLLRSAKEEVVLANGEKLFLKWIDDAGGAKLQVAKQPTSLWITPFLMDGSSTLIEVGLLVRSKESPELTEEKMQFVLEESKQEKEREVEEQYFRNLSNAKWWGRDLFYDTYGGDEYTLLGKKQKLQILTANDSYLLFVSPGDYLVWEEGRWHHASAATSTSGKPLAYIKTVSDKELEVQAWDERGFYPSHIVLHPQVIPRLNFKLELTPSSLRLRTSSQVTSLFGKRRVVLREGDWLLKQSSGWHILRTAQEIEACLQHRVLGELFVFDQIEKNASGFVVQGHLFDEMRVQMLPITLPISAEKKASAAQREKRSPALLRRKK